MTNQITLGYKHLSNLPKILEELVEVQTLEYLTIWAGNMKSLPNILSCLHQVKNLHVLDGYFERIPLPILEMSNLLSLSLRDNKINCISGVSSLEKLEFLDLGQNKISQIDEEIGQLQSLKKIYLDDNPIISISPAFYNLKRLEYFSIDRTAIASINLDNLPESIVIDMDNEDDSFGW